MGRFDFEVSQDFLAQLGSMQEVDRIAPKMLDEAVPVLERRVKAEAAKHKKSGDLWKSIKKTKAGPSPKGGYYVCVRPTGKDRRGTRNMAKMAYLEYGTSQSPEKRPILTKALKDSKDEVEKVMREVFEREVKG